MGLKRIQWDEMLNYCFEEDHSFCYYNLQKPKRLRCMKNFQEILFFAPDSNPEIIPPDKPNKLPK